MKRKPFEATIKQEPADEPNEPEPAAPIKEEPDVEPGDAQEGMEDLLSTLVAAKQEDAAPMKKQLLTWKKAL